MPNTDNVSRYVPLSKLRNDGTADSEAFRIYPKDESFLSVDWLEYLSNSACRLEEKLTAITKIILETGRLQIRPASSAKFAVLNIQKVMNAFSKKFPNMEELEFWQVAETADSFDSHAGIFGYEGNDEVEDLICNTIVAHIPVAQVFPK